MELNLAEELLLLGLDDKSGDIILSATTALPYGIAGAMLLELFLRDKADIVNDKVVVKDPSSIGDELLDEVLHAINLKIEPQETKYWVRKINSIVDNLIDRMIDKLVQKNILKIEHKKILWLIPVDKYPMKDPLPTVHTRLMIRQIVLEDGEPNRRTLALLSLVKASNLIDELFLKDERKQATNIIDDFIKNEKIGKAVSDINAEIMAVIASSVAGTVAAASVVGTY